MPGTTPIYKQPPPAPSAPARRAFLTRAETATLAGMVLTVFSLFLVWEHLDVKTTPLPLPTLYAMPTIAITHRGFGTPARWPLTICAALGGALLLWPDSAARARLPLALVQGACGLACVVIALTRLAPQPGPLIALLGGALLTFGAIDRYTVPAVPPEKI